MSCIVGQFVAVRMIVLDYDGIDDPGGRRLKRQDFENWMKEVFLDEMGKNFHPELERITFLRGNKKEMDEQDPLGDKPVQSYQNVPEDASVPPDQSTDAGANADFAWITYWTNRAANRKAWRKQRPPKWKELWEDFRSSCHKKVAGRPKHGPPYDYVSPSGEQNQFGAGAGCLVEGFEVIYDKSRDDWQ